MSDYEGYKVRIEEQSLSLPVVSKQNHILKERIRDLERELNMTEVENKVLKNKLEIVKEDYTTIKLG